MIENAALISQRTPGTPTCGGDVSYSAAVEFNARCVVQRPTDVQIVRLANKAAGATALLCILKAKAPTFSPAPRHLITFKIDGGSERTAEVVWVTDVEKSGGLAHWEVFLKEQ